MPHCILVLWGTAERKIAPEVVVDDDVASRKTIKRDRLISLGIVASIVVGVVFIAQRRLAYDSPMWADEAWTWLVIHRPLGGVVGVVFSDEANMGPYYLGLRLWAMFGESDAWLRGFSVVAGVGAAVSLFFLVQRYFERRTAVLAVVLLVLNPTFVYYLTEARGYMWSMFLAVLSVTFLLPRNSSSMVVVGLSCTG